MEKIRFCELMEGDVFIMLGHIYTVKKKEGGRTFFFPESSDTTLNDYGENSQQYVELLNKKKQPVKIYPKIALTVGDVRPDNNYTNISGHLKTIEKYSK